MTPIFYSSLGIKLTHEQIIETIIRFMRVDEQRRYKIIIGSDSEKNGSHSADFVTAIVCHRVGNGGIYFWRRIQSDNCHTLRDRIWHEVMLSLDVSKDFLNRMKERAMPLFDFEVHIDVGDNGPTKELIQELVGVVRANNFEARTKPDSYAASKIADRHVK